MKTRNLVILLLLLFLVGCSVKETPKPNEPTPVEPKPVEPKPVEPKPIDPTPIEPAPVEPQPEEPTEPSDPVQTYIESLTLRQKIGQLITIRPEALDESISTEHLEDINSLGATQLTSNLIEKLKEYPVGGFIFFSKNIINPNQLKQFIADINNNSIIFPFISIDEEGGLVSRLASNPNFDLPQFSNMATITTIQDAYTVGTTIGAYLKEYGFNVDFAPVADVNSNPNNPIIGSRSFSSDPQIVAEMVSAVVNGLHDANVMSTLKHFPGHGDTSTDTHFESAITYKNLDELKALEFIPFEEGIKANTDLIMMAHILTPNVTTDNLPASLSKEIHQILRDQLNFTGLVTTDSLSMKAITNYYSSIDAAVLAFEAGNDILLMPANVKDAFDSLEQAVTSHRIDEKELDQRVHKILEYKLKYNIIQLP